MSEEDIRQYLSKQSSAKPVPTGPIRVAARRVRREAPQESFKNFSATHLLCPTCRRAMPVREKLLLYLPDGDLYDYLCSACGTSVGTRKAGR